MARIWQLYQTALISAPVRTAAVTAGTLMTAGDALAQIGVERRTLQNYDIKRSLRFTIFGTFLGGPLFSVWYRTLARVFGGANYGNLKMVACDQLLFAPPFLMYFLAGMEVLKGEGLQQVQQKLKDDYLEVMKTNYKVWPAVQAINFTFIPVHNRIVLVNVVAVFWNTYLALMSERPTKHEALEHTHDTLEQKQDSLPVDGETAKLS